MTGSFPHQAAGTDVYPIRVPRESVNADTVYLVSWLVPDAALIEAGAPVCEVETSKAVFTVSSEQSGYLRHFAAVGEEIPVGGILGYVTLQADTALPVGSPKVGVPAQSPVRISAKAKQLIAQFGLEESLFEGMGFVRERDVIRLVEARHPPLTREDPRGPFRIEPLSPVQRRVARVMEQSVAGTPVAYLERGIDTEKVRQRAQELMAESGVLVTPVDLLIAAVGRVASEFTRFNGFLTADCVLRVFTQVHVGVAVDVEHDLYVVVIKNVASKPVPVIAKEFHNLQYLAQRRRLGVSELTGGTITVTSMLGRGIHRFQPIPYPEQAAIVGICDPEPGSTHAMVTLGFDHRVANGSEAAAFLAAIDASLHSQRAGP